MAGKTILAVFGDRGGWNACEPPLLKALDAGCAVRVYFTATCGKQYTDGKLKTGSFFEVQAGDSDKDSIQKFMHHPHDLLVVGSSQSKEGSRASAYALTDRDRTSLVVQDAYGSAVPMLALLYQQPLRPYVKVCVTDEFSRAHLMQTISGLGLYDVIVTGGPHFDKVVEMRRTREERRRTLRQALNVGTKEPVFLIAGGVGGTDEILELLEAAIEQAGLAETAKVILRAHPRAREEDKVLTAAFMNAPKYPGWFTDVDRALAPTSDDLLPAADFVLSGFSTTNTIGILLQMPGVVYVGTPTLKKDLMDEKKLERPPEVEAGAAWYVQTAADMAGVITAIRLGARDVPHMLKIVAAQERIASFNDGKATERVWAEMQKLMA
ncbi:MAG: hypothetical protein G01um1014106_265 [Parcubacteria group bacterium Gr01-1014_106]|nr:MAG: hypothetical protein G01um1014106_265 [Parcubacteria group bacterium Gr01-1014_106]